MKVVSNPCLNLYEAVYIEHKCTGNVQLIVMVHWYKVTSSFYKVLCHCESVHKTMVWLLSAYSCIFSLRGLLGQAICTLICLVAV